MIPAQITITDAHFADAYPADPRRTAVALAVAEVMPAGVMAFDHRDGAISYRIGPLSHERMTVRLSDEDQLALDDQRLLLMTGNSEEPVVITLLVPEAHEVVRLTVATGLMQTR